jgi:RNA polymerase sigma factor (sigma-70 family)
MADTARVQEEVRRGQALDRDIAGELGRAPVARSPDAGAYAAALDGRPARRQDERALLAAARAGDAAARAGLVEAYMPQIAGVARLYRTGRVQRQELLQEGVVGLLRALERFDPDRGLPFWAYAAFWVRQAMQQLVAELTRPAVLSDRALRHLSRLRQAHHEALKRTAREPRREELAEMTGLELEQVDDLLAMDRAPRALDEPVTGHEGDVGVFGDLLVDPLAEDEYERVLSAIEVEALHDLLAGLSDRERHVLRARYGLDGDERSLRDLGEALGLSGERIRQIERRALGKLAAEMTAT